MTGVSTESHVERDVCQYFEKQELFHRISCWAPQMDVAPVLADVVILAGFYDRDDYRFVPYFRYLSS